ncbi:MAG: LysR family transcriptional regulator [Candidatus Thiodiazotropha sp. (ex Codakia rugifera)]|nr:LysR family transcriptional regulator [Candidatus Thiodiazotropha sp. (ex Codakia rugifera)]
MMDRLTAMRVFVEVAKQGSFVSAARTLGMSASSISRQLMSLEQWLDVELLHRTTRQLNLTDAGRSYLQRCIQIVGEVDDMEQDAKALRKDPGGEVRISAPIFIGRYLLARMLPGFTARFPMISLQLQLLDREVNLVDEGFDLALRVGELAESTLVARRLDDVQIILCAAPSYLDKYGIPKTVRDLKQHNCLVDTVPQHGHRWPFVENKKRVVMPVKGNVTANGGELVRELAISGMGIAYLPSFFVDDDIAQNRLVVLLDKATEMNPGLFLVYPKTKHLSSTVRVFIDYLVEYSQHTLTSN